MARIRTIKPTFWADEKVAMVPRDVRLTLLGIISAMCDDHGRARAKPRLVIAAVYPLDDDISVEAVDDHLRQIERTGMLVLYEVAGERYLQVTNWSKHQKINRPSDSQLPPPPRKPKSATTTLRREASVSAHGGFSESSVSPPSVVEGKGGEWKGRDITASGEATNSSGNGHGWPAEGAAIWVESVGHITVGHFGKALKPMVDRYGWEDSKAAMLTYIELNEGKPRSPEWLVKEAVRWIALAKMPCVDPESRELTEKGRMAYQS